MKSQSRTKFMNSSLIVEPALYQLPVDTSVTFFYLKKQLLYHNNDPIRPNEIPSVLLMYSNGF